MIGNEERECSDREMDAVMKANDKQCTRSLPILPLGRKIGALVEVAEWPAGIPGPCLLRAQEQAGTEQGDYGLASPRRLLPTFSISWWTTLLLHAGGFIPQEPQVGLETSLVLRVHIPYWG